MMIHESSSLQPVDPQELEALRLELEQQLGLLNQLHGTPEEVGNQGGTLVMGLSFTPCAIL